MVRFIKSYASAALLCCLSFWCVNGDDLARYLNDPSVCAFLDTIAWAEGTLTKDTVGYRCIFGYQTFNDFSDHPRRSVCTVYNGGLLCSTAAGKYQILQSTWDKIADKAGVKDFSPRSQDRAAIYLLLDCGALQELRRKSVPQNKSFCNALKKACHIWASMPGSPYDQPTKKERDLYEVYKRLCAYHKNRLYKKEGGI